MPLLVSFIGSVSGALATFFASFMGMQAALRFAAYTAWMLVLAAFLVTVAVCLNSLLSMAQALISGTNGSGIGWVSYFFMGVGMFIPANAGAVLSCVASVWIGTSVYRVQKHGIENYAK